MTWARLPKTFHHAHSYSHPDSIIHQATAEDIWGLHSAASNVDMAGLSSGDLSLISPRTNIHYWGKGVTAIVETFFPTLGTSPYEAFVTGVHATVLVMCCPEQASTKCRWVSCSILIAACPLIVIFPRNISCLPSLIANIHGSSHDSLLPSVYSKDWQ